MPEIVRSSASEANAAIYGCAIANAHRALPSVPGGRRMGAGIGHPAVVATIASTKPTIPSR
jgi:hypothetical protein